MWSAVVLILTLVLNIGLSVNSDNINLTYILKRENTRLQPSCIAEEFERYAGVGWVYPIPTADDELPAITTKFIPKIENKIFNCKFANNEFCNIHWEVRDWSIDTSSPKTKEFIGDSRWDDLPTIFISNNSKAFEHRYHIEGASKSGFSIRTSAPVEVFLCSGWNPENYPCYRFKIDGKEATLRKFNGLPKNIEDGPGSNVLQRYQASQKILADDEWRSFEVILENGVLRLIDKNLNRTAIEYTDEQPIELTYFLMRSEEPSLWKISQNNFMYTKTAQKSRMGPVLSTNTKDLCVSLFVSTCNNCKMTFFYLKQGNKKILREVSPTNEAWIEIKLKDENIKDENINLFVDTQFQEDSLNQTEGFWAYDDVRICNENEVKVSYLKINETFDEDDITVDVISCQLVNKPSWRPYKLVYDEIKDFPLVKITSNESSISLSWEQEDPDNYISYFISYQGSELCQDPDIISKRSKSNGFKTTKTSEVVLNDLLPYTAYNITISSVFHENDKHIIYSTMESDRPSFEEIPFQLSIIPTENSVNVTWNKPDCRISQGRLIYDIIVTKDDFKKSLELQTDSSFLIGGLEPFTEYNLTIVTARNARHLTSGIGTYSLPRTFKTLAGVARTVENLELYAIDTQTAYLRYDLPGDSNGVPSEIQIMKCNAKSNAKCRSTMSRIEKCKIWNDKYCAEVNVLEEQEYNFKVAVKNRFTNSFGDYGTEVFGIAEDRVPASPRNITYEIVDCVGENELCHLNVTWYHPKNPNATITFFNIMMNSTNFNTTNSEEDEAIHEVYAIRDGIYLPKYTIEIKNVPFSDSYNLYIQSSNAKYSSDYVGITVKATDNLGHQPGKSPHLLGKSAKALVFQLPEVDKRLKKYQLIVAVQDYNETVKLERNKVRNKKLKDNLCHKYGNAWVVEILEVESTHPLNSQVLTVTSVDEKHVIQPDTKYCVIFIVTTNTHGDESDIVYFEKHRTLPGPEDTQGKEGDKASSANNVHLWGLLPLLLIIPLGFLIYRCLKKRRDLRKKQAAENFYETLPFDESPTNNYANNKHYDHLVHK